MPEYLAPGVYTEEISSGPPPIAAIGTTTTGFVGVARRGPESGRPTLVTSYAEFVRAFGGAFDFPGFDDHRDMPDAARGFFANGGRRLYVSRVVPAAATAASVTLRGGVITRLGADALPGATTVKLLTTRGLREDSELQLVMNKNGIATTHDVVVDSIDPATDIVTLTAALPAAPAPTMEARFTVVLTDVDGVSEAMNATYGRVTALTDAATAKPTTFDLVAASAGSWGGGVQIAVGYRSAGRALVKHAEITGGNTVVPVTTTAGFYPNAWVEVVFGPEANQKVYRKVTQVVGTSLVLSGTNLAAGAWDPDVGFETRITTCEFDLTLSWTDPTEGAAVTERFTGLTLENVPGRHYATALAASTLVDVGAAAPASTHPFFFPSAPDGLADSLSTAGSDGAAPTAADYVGSDVTPNAETGLKSLELIDEIALLAAPGVTDVGVQGALIEQATRLMDRFAVLDPPATATLDEIQLHASNFDTRYAAIYHPRVMVTDPLTGLPRAIAPSGHVLGVYARVDNTRGVHKAPANEVLLAITGLEQTVTRGQQEILNPRGINVLRDLRAERRGLRVFGARCLTSEQDWVYVNVRRLFIFVEEALSEGTQWVVFEPNDQRLWRRVRDSISIFLEGVWRDGALMGEKPEQAFFVTCDRTTMTDDDILNGRLVVEIGIAPVRPAEFVILRIGQWLGGTHVAEL